MPRLEEWKSHIVRSVHQDAAKTTVIDALSKTEALLIMDWAMKFLPTSYRETQRDWFGKKGKSWHITVAILRQDNENIEVLGQVLSHKIELCGGRLPGGINKNNLIWIGKCIVAMVTTLDHIDQTSML